MARAPRIMINAPKTATAGEIIEIKTLVQHPMETGYRTGVNGKQIPRDILTRFECRYNGDVVFAADLFPAIAANPFIAFTTVATKSGKLTFTWTGDNRRKETSSVKITVK
jgi:sulfur-oxidizing protein SoxZ